MTEHLAAPSVEVTVACNAWFDDCPQAAAIAAGAAQAALRDAAAGKQFIVDVTLADDAAQRHLNRVYRGKDMPTNVLAFPQREAGSPQRNEPMLLGDVVLACETVRREAAEQAKPIENHLRHLVVHGVLHLLGFDHENNTEAATMEAREIKILAGLGVPDPYRGIM
jgi:probable rRNA maturation factor